LIYAPAYRWAELLAQVGPLTFDFKLAPAENFGTRLAGIVIRSPVRGLTPFRGPRSTTWNFPKPGKFTSSPRLSVPCRRP
jgi:hypothetical protein